MEFYNVLKQLRKQNGINQETLAEFLGISTQAVSKWECGLSYPYIELLPTLAGYFKVSIDFLLTGKQRTEQINGVENFTDDNTLYIGSIKIIRYYQKTGMTRLLKLCSRPNMN